MEMNKTICDINNRFNMAVSERSGYEKGSKYYEQLSEVIAFILGEYQRGDMRKHSARHGFRMDTNGYRMVILEKSENC